MTAQVAPTAWPACSVMPPLGALPAAAGAARALRDPAAADRWTWLLIA